MTIEAADKNEIIWRKVCPERRNGPNVSQEQHALEKSDEQEDKDMRVWVTAPTRTGSKGG